MSIGKNEYFPQFFTFYMKWQSLLHAKSNENVFHCAIENGSLAFQHKNSLVYNVTFVSSVEFVSRDMYEPSNSSEFDDENSLCIRRNFFCKDFILSNKFLTMFWQFVAKT